MVELTRALSPQQHCQRQGALQTAQLGDRLKGAAEPFNSTLPLDPAIVLTYRGFQTLTRKADYTQGRPAGQPFSSQPASAASAQLLLAVSFPGD